MIMYLLVRPVEYENDEIYGMFYTARDAWTAAEKLHPEWPDWKPDLVRQCMEVRAFTVGTVYSPYQHPQLWHRDQTLPNDEEDPNVWDIRTRL